MKRACNKQTRGAANMTAGLIKFRSFLCYRTARSLFLRSQLYIPQSYCPSNASLHLCIVQQVKHALPCPLWAFTFKFPSLFFNCILHVTLCCSFVVHAILFYHFWMKLLVSYERKNGGQQHIPITKHIFFSSFWHPFPHFATNFISNLFFKFYVNEYICYCH